MFKNNLKEKRPQKHLVLNENAESFVNGSIAQYLLNHQINGIRFLYGNFIKQKTSILNDESSTGKCFQCVAFFDAVLRYIPSSRILIICQSKQSTEHWKYHVDRFLDSVSVHISDKEIDSSADNNSSTISIASLDYVVNHLSDFTRIKYDCVVLQDQHLNISSVVFAQLKQIQTTCKIIICSDDLMNDIEYFYELLQFCDLLGSLNQPNTTHALSLEEFKLKFGCNNKTVSKRNLVFRQTNLLNTCIDFYMRRHNSQCGSQIPPIKREDFERDFKSWQIATTNSPSLHSNEDDASNSTIELLPNPNNQSIVSENDEMSLLNTACADLSEFDTQMSPLIYTDSENSNDVDDLANQIQDSQSSRITTPDIVCNQEQAAKIRKKTKGAIQLACHVTPTKQSFRTNRDKISPASKRLNYRRLPIKINGNAKCDSLSRTYLFRMKKQAQANATISSDSQLVAAGGSPSRQSSPTPDIQIVSDANSSPIVISTSEDDAAPYQNDVNKETHLNSENSCPSPDLFASFSSIHSNALTQQILGIQSSQESSKTSNSQSSSNGCSVIPETDAFHEVFGAPDECDDIDLLSNTNVDIFEITKNNVFDNVLCSADDKITPVKKSVANTTSPKSSLSGLRIMLPRLNESQVQQIKDDLLSQSQIRSNADDVIDLTAQNSQQFIEINSSDSVKSREKTPERKQELTPSTRSCLKRSANDRLTTEERRKRSPFSRLGWLSATKTSPRCGTPQSRRKLDNWRRRTNEANPSAEDFAKLTTRPRNLFEEFKSKTNATLRRSAPSTSTARSPNIFTD